MNNMARIQRLNGRIVVGLTEKVTLNGKSKEKALWAKIDTGATKSSMDIALAEQLKLGPVTHSKVVKSAHGSRLRPIVEATIILADRKISTEFTLAERSHMKYKVLIGQNILKDGFLIDPSKK